jgi:hypothetical protein
MRVAMAFVLLAVSASAFVQRYNAPTVPSGLIVGQVIDAVSGRPIAGAIVAITGSGPDRQGGTPPRVLSTSDGRFFFRDLPRGTFTITATKMGYVDGASGRRRPGGASQPITLAESERVGGVVVRMWKRAAITGTVVDEMGEPVIGVQVRAFRREFAGGRPRYVTGAVFVQPSASTDDRGIFRLGSLIPGDYVVATVGRPVAMSIPMAQEFQARGPGVADIGPISLPGTSSGVQIGNAAYGLGWGVPIPAPSREGRLLVYPQTFYPSVPTFPQAMIVSIGPGEERAAIDLQIHPLSTVRVGGTVVGPEGAAIALALRLFPAASDDVGVELNVPTAVTDRHGNFEFPAVAPGQYLLRASMRLPQSAPRTPLDGTHWLEATIAVGHSDIEGLVFSLQPGLRVTGSFEFEGTTSRPASRLEQVSVSLEAAGVPANGHAQVGGRVEADGRFTVAGPPPGRYLLRVSGSPEGWMFKEATYRGRNVSDEPFDLESDANDVAITFTNRWTGCMAWSRARAARRIPTQPY